MSESNAAVLDTAVDEEARYDRDVYAWSLRQAALLRAGRFDEIDLANVAEEIESVGRSERSELVNRLAVLLQHLLKWRYQSRNRSASWQTTIAVQRNDIRDHLADNPSLKSVLEELIERAYRRARLEARGKPSCLYQPSRSNVPGRSPARSMTISGRMPDDLWAGGPCRS